MAANLTRSFTTAPDTAPSVTSSSPANGATNVDNLATITVNFSEPITDDANAFSLVCNSVAQTFTGAGGSGSQFTLSPTSPLPYSASCTLTVDATKIHDNDTDDPPDNMAANYTATFTVEAAPPTCSGTLTPIHDVQGNGSTSPIVGATVTVRGIVVGDFQDIGGNRLDGFYLQEEAAEYDADPNTSEGVFVFEGSFAAPNVNVGDQVQVTGVVTEFSSSGTTLTEIATLTSVIVCSTGNPLPPATTLDLPATNATREALENMLVTIPETLTVTENFNLDRFGEIELIANGRQYTYTQLNYPSVAGYSAYTANYALHTITLDDGISASWPAEVIFPAPRLTNANSFRAGDTVAGLTGVLEQRFGVYRIQPTASVTFTQDNPRPTSVPTFATTPDVTVASFNVLNFFNGNGVGGGFPTSRGAQSIDEYNRQLNKLVTALYAIHADVFGLMEIENDSGPNQAAASLVAALNAEFGSTEYAYIDTGVMGTDEIKVAIIYRVNGVIPVGSYATLGGNPFDQNTRPPLAQTFEDTLTGARFTVVVNHFKSKGSVPSSGALPGDVDQGDGQGMSNATRVLAAELVRDWIDTNAYFSDPDVLLIGDYNSYYYEDPITVFTNAGYGQLTNNTDYSYTFDGQLGSLDHALGSPSLLPYVIGTFDWHINTDEADAHDYNIQVFTSPNVFRTAQQQAEWFNRDYYRTSDHDPIIIGLDLPNEARRFEFITQPPTSVVQNAPFTVAVELRDPFGFPVLSNGVPITLALNTNPGGSTLGGTLTVNTVNGVATFSDLTLNNLGTGYDLIATSPDITDRVSNAFNVVAGAPVTVSTQNPILTINDAGNHVAEGATVGDQFSFNLNAQPTADVVVTFTTSNPAQLLMVAPGSTNWSPTPSYSVTFSLDGRPGTGLWNRTTLVNLTAVADGFGEGVHTANINITTSSADPAFNNLVIAPQVVNIYEPGVILSTNQIYFNEGETPNYTVVLTAPPGFIAAPARLGGLQAEVVTVTPSSSNPSRLGVSPVLNFTRANWNVPQTVTLNGIIGGPYLVTHGVSSTITINPYMDTAYGGSGTNVTAGSINVIYFVVGSESLPPEVIPPLGEEPILPEAPAGESQAPIAGS
ncbi:MAG: ExeM/NucH family extracellular endonuclease [Anaerolinea sp.]|nr:ExeM/NucH family extracellular endonuclease [Anaerolinea sp.]